METNDATRQELSDRCIDSNYAGTDAKGRIHYCERVDVDAVWVVDDGEIVHVEPGAALGEWTEFVTDRVGWHDCTYTTKSLVETIAEAEGCA